MDRSGAQESSREAEHGVGDPVLRAAIDAGTAIDVAQVAGDVVAQRVVDLAADDHDGRSVADRRRVRRAARRSRRITRRMRRLSRRYEALRRAHLGVLGEGVSAGDPTAVEALRDVQRTGSQVEREATALLLVIDDTFGVDEPDASLPQGAGPGAPATAAVTLDPPTSDPGRCDP